MLKLNAQCGQDLFVYKLLNKKTNGTFIEIGCNFPDLDNNTFFLEKELNWRGICIDIHKFDYRSRKCKYIQQNALEINYNKLFRMNNISNIIDYLSLDIDDHTNECLKKMPFDEYYFKIITIEHDFYRLGDKLRSEQRKFLRDRGYFLMCANVCENVVNQPYEDWWINPKFVDYKNFNHLISDGLSYREIIKKLYAS